MNHFETVPSNPQRNTMQIRELSLDFNKFLRRLTLWGCTLIITLLPSIVAFIFFYGPQYNFDYLDLFRDHALIYVCVTMSALAIYTYRKVNLVFFMNGIIILFGIMAYTFTSAFTRVNDTLPLFAEYDHREFIFWFLSFTCLISILTLLLASKRSRGKF